MTLPKQLQSAVDALQALLHERNEARATGRFERASAMQVAINFLRGLLPDHQRMNRRRDDPQDDNENAGN